MITLKFIHTLQARETRRWNIRSLKAPNRQIQREKVQRLIPTYKWTNRIESCSSFRFDSIAKKWTPRQRWRFDRPADCRFDDDICSKSRRYVGRAMGRNIRSCGNGPYLTCTDDGGLTRARVSNTLFTTSVRTVLGPMADDVWFCRRCRRGFSSTTYPRHVPLSYSETIRPHRPMHEQQISWFVLLDVV